MPAKWVQQLSVDDALRNGRISYSIQVLIAYCRMRAGLLVVSVGGFSSDQDLPFIRFVAAMQRVRALQPLTFNTSEVCPAGKVLADDPSESVTDMVVLRHNLAW